jgi:hypothetical protein
MLQVFRGFVVFAAAGAEASERGVMSTGRVNEKRQPTTALPL